MSVWLSLTEEIVSVTHKHQHLTPCVVDWDKSRADAWAQKPGHVVNGGKKNMNDLLDIENVLYITSPDSELKHLTKLFGPRLPKKIK